MMQDKAVAGLLLSYLVVCGAVSAPCGQKAPISVPICALAENWKAYDGKMVQIAGFVVRFGRLTIYSACKEGGVGVFLNFADEPGLGAPFGFVRDANFALFSHYVDAGKYRPAPAGAGRQYYAYRYCKVAARFTGLFNGVSDDDAFHGRGFGNGRFPYRLIVRSVSDPIAEECPYEPEPPPEPPTAIPSPSPLTLGPPSLPPPPPAKPPQGRK